VKKISRLCGMECGIIIIEQVIFLQLDKIKNLASEYLQGLQFGGPYRTNIELFY